MKRFLPPLLFAGALLIITEMTFRVYLYGAASLNPFKMDSYTQILDSGLIQSAADPAIQYELKPNLDTWYKGKRFRTNSAGLRGPEIPLEKPANTIRIAVLGASWSMGSGVEEEDIWHAQLATLLNEESDFNYEVINFALDQYSVGEIVPTMEKKTLAYQPDVIVVALTHYTPTVLWQDPPEKFVVQPTRHPFFDLHSLRVLDYNLQLGWFSDEHSRRPAAGAQEGSVGKQLRKALDRMVDFSETTGIPVVVTKIAYSGGWGKQGGDLIGNALSEYQGKLIYYELTELIRSYGYMPAELRVSVWDSHPNRKGHGLIAQAFIEIAEPRKLLESKTP